MPDLVTTALLLLSGSPDRAPGEAEFRRCVSTAYYAMFHNLAQMCATELVGPRGSGLARAWTQTFRALDHGAARGACTDAQADHAGFPAEIQEFGLLFVRAQRDRHVADYDPAARFDARFEIGRAHV